MARERPPRSAAEVKRSRSDSQLSVTQADVNKNVEWTRSRSFWASYVFLIVLVRVTLWVLMPKWPGSDKWEWTLVNAGNFIVRPRRC